MPDLTLETRTIEQLPRAAGVPAGALLPFQVPGSAAQSIELEKVVGHLVQTGTIKTTEALLQASLDFGADTIALVYADPTPAKNGWWRKVGASGAGNWSQFEKLSAQAKAEVEAAITAAMTAINAAVATAQGAAATALSVADVSSVIPQIGRDNQERIELDTGGKPIRWQTRNRRMVSDIAPAVIGVDTSGQRLAYVSGGNINVLGAAGDVITIPGTANWTGGPTLAPQLAGMVDGRSVLTINRPFAQAQQAVMIGSDGAMAPLPNPNELHVIFTDGQSLGHGTLGRWFNSTSMWATPTLPRGVFMLARTGEASDVRCGRNLNFLRNDNTTVAANQLTGFIPAGPRLWPATVWSSTNFGETIAERFAKMYSDKVFAATGRRPMVLIQSLAVGAISIDNMQKTGAAVIPGTTSVKYAQDLVIINRIKALCDARGLRPVAVAVLRKHGETSSEDPAYATKATQQINDLNGDIRTIFGQAGNPIWIEHAQSSYGSGAAVNSVLALQSMHDAGTLHLAGADYPLLGKQGFEVTGVATPPNWDWVHLSARGYALVGEAMFDQFWQVFAFNRRRKVTRLISATASGVTLTCRFDSHSGAIEAVGAPGWTDPGNLGLTYSDTSGGTVPIVTGANVVGADVILTMSGSLAGRTGRLASYALNYSGSAGFSPTTKPRGMIRDPSTSLGVSEVDGLMKHGWALPSQAPVTGA